MIVIWGLKDYNRVKKRYILNIQTIINPILINLINNCLLFVL